MTRPRRLLMTTDAVGGVWSYSLELAAGLAAEDVETVLVVLGPQPSVDQVAEAAAVPGLGLVTPGLGLEWQDRQPLGSAEARLLRTLERAFAPDVVHVNGFREAACGWRAPVVLVAHSCVRSWWRACRGCEPPLEDWADYKAGVRAGLAAADAIVAPTAAFLGELQQLYGPLSNARTIHNGRAPPLLRTRRRSFVLGAGRLWDEAKNVAALAEIADGLSWPVLVAGESAGVQGAQSLVQLGRLPQSELLRRMAEAGIFVSPARYEPFGLAILEAAAAGAALVLADLPTLRELWDGAARFVLPNDSAALGTALQRLIDDEPARRSLQVAARHRARRYGPAPMVAGYLELYGELSAGGGSGRAAAA